ncbi:MAG: inorganic diphosphatase, partial [Myxococcota bacterium]
NPSSALPPSVRVRIEVPKGSHIKRAADGRVDFVSPLPSPFNYGSVPDVPSADGEPLDALVLGPPLALADERVWPVHGVVYFIDEGVCDDKLVCGAHAPTAKDVRQIRAFFRRYAAAKGLWASLRGRGPVRFVGWEARA